jgi:glycerophosphoryl diester phosphodiesterase
VKKNGIAFSCCLPLLLLVAPDPVCAQESLRVSGEPGLRMPEIIAHRGASWDAPENTLASIQLAWAMDADAVEFDIFLTADGEIVAFHDRTTQRIAGRDRPVEEQTLAELRELDYGAWKGPQWAGERIPTLAEVLSTLPRGKRMVVEPKTDVRIVRPMLEVFDRIEHHPHQLVVISFHFEVVAETKRLRPRTPALYLEGFHRDEATGEWSPTMAELVERAVAANLDGLNLRFQGPATVAEDVALIRRAGLGYYVWTVNDLDDAQRALELGVDGLTTDRPSWMKKQLLARNGWRLLPRP